MINQTIIVGRLVENPIISEDERKTTTITVAVPRTYKNINGEYDVDFIDCKLYKHVAQNTTDYCQKGDLVGVKGRLANLDGNALVVVAEKVTFLSSRGKVEV